MTPNTFECRGLEINNKESTDQDHTTNINESNNTNTIPIEKIT